LGCDGSEIPHSIFLDSYSMRLAVRPFWASVVDSIFAMYVMTHDNATEDGELYDHSWGAFEVAEDVLLLAPTVNKDEYRRVGLGWVDATVGLFLGSEHTVLTLV
jgi:hypothetical protein